MNPIDRYAMVAYVLLVVFVAGPVLALPALVDAFRWFLAGRDRRSIEAWRRHLDALGRVVGSEGLR